MPPTPISSASPQSPSKNIRKNLITQCLRLLSIVWRLCSFDSDLKEPVRRNMSRYVKIRQIGYQVGTNLVPSWYKAGTNLVPTWYQHGTNLVPSSTAMALLWQGHGAAMALPWHRHGTSTALPWRRHGTDGTAMPCPCVLLAVGGLDAGCTDCVCFVFLGKSC